MRTNASPLFYRAVVLVWLIAATRLASAGPFTDPGHLPLEMTAWATSVGDFLAGPLDIAQPGLGSASFGLPALVLGPSIARGSLVRAVPIGLLRVVDHLERDDKILAIVPGTPLSDVDDVAELDARYPGVREILTNWYANARPGGALEVQGFGSRAAARRLIADCAREFDAAERDGSMPDWQTP